MRTLPGALVLALLVAMVLSPPAKADETFAFAFSFDKDNSFGSFGISIPSGITLNGAGFFTATPFPGCDVLFGTNCPSPPAGSLQVDSLTGVFNGSPMTLVRPLVSGLYPIPGVIVPGSNGSAYGDGVLGDGTNGCCFLQVGFDISFTANGELYQWGGNDAGGNWNYLFSDSLSYLYSHNVGGLPIEWDIIAAPEPPTLLLLLVGVVGLIGPGVWLQKCRYART